MLSMNMCRRHALAWGDSPSQKKEEHDRRSHNARRKCAHLVPRPILGKVCRRAPADHGSHALTDLVGAAAALRRHRFGPLWVEQLGAVLQAQHLLQLARLDLQQSRFMRDEVG